jgi:hypothetical protein
MRRQGPSKGKRMNLRLLCTGTWLAATLVSGCVIETSAAPGGVAVSGPPPEPMHEARSPPLGPSTIWIAGYWHWTGMQYTWIPGHWEEGRPGVRWRAPRYLLRDGVYYYEPGKWFR